MKKAVSVGIALAALGLVTVPGTVFNSGPSGTATEIFKATFNNSSINVFPGPPEVGSWPFASDAGGTIVVRNGLGDLTDKLVELQRTGSSSLSLVGLVDGTPPSSGVFIVRWRAMVHSGSFGGSVTVFGDDGCAIFTVSHASVNQTIYSNFGVSGVGVSWVTDVSQLFEVAIDLDNRVTVLRIDGDVVADDVPFQDPRAANIKHIVLHLGSTLPHTFVIDDVEIGPGRRTNVPR